MATMTQSQVEQWIAQNGGPNAVQYAIEQKSVKNPSFDPYDDSKGPQYITVPVETWKNSKTGATLSVKRTDSGDFDLWENTGADPNKPGAGGEQTPEQKNAAELQRQREKNAALPADQDPAYETDAERRTRAEARIKQQGADAEAARQRQRQDEADARARAEANKGTTQLKPDGQGGTIAVTTYPDGRAPTTVPVPGVPSEATSKYTQVKQDPTTGAWSGLTATGKWEPIEGGPGINTGRRPLPPGMPPLDTSSPEKAHASYLAQVQWAQEQRQAGKLSAQEITELLTPSYNAAKSVIDMGQQQITNASTLRGQDLTERGQNLNEVQSRRSAADSGFDSLFNQINGNAAHLGRGNGGLAAAAFRDALALRQAYATQAGGYQDIPNTQVSPALQSVRTAGASTLIHPDGTVQISHAAPSGQAVDAVANGVTATNAAAVDPTGQNVQAATDATVNGFNQAVEPLLKPPPAVPGQAPVSMARPAYLGADQPQAAPPPFDPARSQTVARLRAEGWPQEDIDQLIREHNQDFAA